MNLKSMDLAQHRSPGLTLSLTFRCKKGLGFCGCLLSLNCLSLPSPALKHPFPTPKRKRGKFGFVALLTHSTQGLNELISLLQAKLTISMWKCSYKHCHMASTFPFQFLKAICCSELKNTQDRFWHQGEDCSQDRTAALPSNCMSILNKELY